MKAPLSSLLLKSKYLILTLGFVLMQAWCLVELTSAQELPQRFACRGKAAYGKTTYNIQLTFKYKLLGYKVSGTLVGTQRNLRKEYKVSGGFAPDIRFEGTAERTYPPLPKGKKPIVLNASGEQGITQKGEDFKRGLIIKVYRSIKDIKPLQIWCEYKLPAIQALPTPTPYPTATPNPVVTTENWAGKWVCEGPGDATLTIAGQGSGSTMSASFASAVNGPASDVYTFKNIALYSADGSYIYRNSLPGDWPGNFSLTISGEVIHLVRQDLSSSWHGEYYCRR